MTPQDLDLELILAFLVFMASFMAGMELSQMARKVTWWKGDKFRPDQKGAALAVVIVLAVLLLMYLVGGEPPNIN